MRSEKKKDPLKFLWKIPEPEPGKLYASVSGILDEPAPVGYVWRVFDPKHAIERLDRLEAKVRRSDEHSKRASMSREYTIGQHQR